MKLDKYSKISQIPDRELLECIFATQMQILRALEIQDVRTTKSDTHPQELQHAVTASGEMISKIPVWTERINDYLAKHSED